MNKKEKSGMEDLPEGQFSVRLLCRDPQHNPPTMIVIPRGKRYRHVCPSCGVVSYLYPATLEW